MSKLIFTNEEILNYYLSLKTKPFAILMGLSGSGKTKLAVRFAEALTAHNQDQYALIPVEAGWNDDKSLLGYYNPLTKTYIKTRFLEILLRAHRNYINCILNGTPHKIKPFFLILDEMNLSKVEYYFSKFLSLIETMKMRPINYFIDESGLTYINKNQIPFFLSEALDLHNEPGFVPIDIKTEVKSNLESKIRLGNIIKDLHGKDIVITERLLIDIEEYNKKNPGSHAIDERDNHLTGQFIRWHYDNNLGKLKTNEECEYIFSDLGYIPPKIRISPNIYFTGTVNIDETTYIFSPKVLDRANSIELTNINIELFENMIKKIGVKSDTDKSLIQLDDVIDDFTYNYKFQLEVGTIEKKSKDYSEFIDEFFSIIKGLNEIINLTVPTFNFGYRVINEMLIYIINALDFMGNDKKNFNFALDIQLKQKILSKVHGMKSELNPLFEALFRDYQKFEKFYDKVKRMKFDLDNKQFTSYM